MGWVPGRVGREPSAPPVAETSQAWSCTALRWISRTYVTHTHTRARTLLPAGRGDSQEMSSRSPLPGAVFALCSVWPGAWTAHRPALPAVGTSPLGGHTPSGPRALTDNASECPAHCAGQACDLRWLCPRRLSLPLGSGGPEPDPPPRRPPDDFSGGSGRTPRLLGTMVPQLEGSAGSSLQPALGSREGTPDVPASTSPAARDRCPLSTPGGDGSSGRWTERLRSHGERFTPRPPVHVRWETLAVLPPSWTSPGARETEGAALCHDVAHAPTCVGWTGCVWTLWVETVADARARNSRLRGVSRAWVFTC